MIASHFTCRMIVALTVSLLVVGCAGRSYINVDYHYRPGVKRLATDAVRLTVVDERQDSAILTDNAKRPLPSFKDRFNLTLVGPDQNRKATGTVDIEALFAEAFAKRLDLIGVTVATAADVQKPIFRVSIQEFKIDRVDRKWKLAVRYQVTLSQKNHPIARETITGSGERLHLLGAKGAAEVVSEIFSDLINKVNMVQLFENARLLR